MQLRHIYFDLGNVLLRFSHERMIAQMAAVSQVPASVAHAAVFDSDAAHALESGRMSREDFYEEYCAQTHSRPPLAALEAALSDIFDPWPESLLLVDELRRTPLSLGILSNTNICHWEFVQRTFPDVPARFAIHALSYELGAMKPAAQIYTAATILACCLPEEIFFLDDRPENVEAAFAAGWDAHLYTGPEPARAALRQRGVAV
jgi:FMN phosphatase YigB (HAD superfamily)